MGKGSGKWKYMGIGAAVLAVVAIVYTKLISKPADATKPAGK